MRAKKAKQARAFAREITAGLPERRYQRTAHGEVKLIPACTRRVYQMIKCGQPLKPLTSEEAK